MVGKLTRSLSGRHSSCTSDSNANKYLWDMLQNESSSGRLLLEQCKKKNGRMLAGGPEVDSAIAAVFAALLWHTQQLRDEVERLAETDGDKVSVSDDILHAYSVAEGLRNYLIELRQKQKVKADENDGEDPIQLCQKKAEFLLQFAGLSRVDTSVCTRLFKTAGKYQRMTSNERHTSITNVHISKAEDNPTLEMKRISLRLVTNFMKETSLTKEAVEEALQERCRRAETLADALSLASEFLKTVPGKDIFQPPNILFLQEMLSCLDKNSTKVPLHYADKINGCGLQLETKVRQAYYSLTRLLVDAVKMFDRKNACSKLVPALDFVQACMLHLLDIPWQLYDLSFLQEIQFSNMLMDIAGSAITVHDVATGDPSDQEELKVYEQYMKWLPECKENVSKWYVIYFFSLTLTRVKILFLNNCKLVFP